MATQKQRRAARRNVKRAQAGARRKQTIKNLPGRTRTALGKEGTKVRRGEAKSRRELYREAQRRGIEGRSKMGRAAARAGALAVARLPVSSGTLPVAFARAEC